jgi:hypothetical protein
MTFRACVVAFILCSSAAATAQELPLFNTQRYCSYLFPGTGIDGDPLDVMHHACLTAEAKFRERAVRVWADIPADVRLECLGTSRLTTAGGSYEELAKCLAAYVAHEYLEGRLGLSPN